MMRLTSGAPFSVNFELWLYDYGCSENFEIAGILLYFKNVETRVCCKLLLKKIS